MKVRSGLLAVAVAFLFGLCAAPAAWADCGSIPFEAPAMGGMSFGEDDGGEASGYQGYSGEGDYETYSGETENISFDPLKVSVFEPQQRAIILWNGEEQILLLSTDQRATEKSAVLEVIPLPSRPTVRLGSFATFEEAQRLAVNRRMWRFASGSADIKVPDNAGRIDFHEKLGAHDLTVAEVLRPQGFIQFVQNHLRENYDTQKAPINPEFVGVIRSYLDQGYKWFAFDVITLDETLRSRDPIEYRFKSDHVFYPLRISSMEKGKTNVDLLVFTASGASRFEDLPAREIKRLETVEVAQREVEGLEKGWKNFFGGATNVKMDQWSVKGKSASLVRDIKAR